MEICGFVCRKSSHAGRTSPSSGVRQPQGINPLQDEGQSQQSHRYAVVTCVQCNMDNYRLFYLIVNMCMVSVLLTPKLRGWLALPVDWEYVAEYTCEVPDSLSSHLGGDMRGQSQFKRHQKTPTNWKGGKGPTGRTCCSWYDDSWTSGLDKKRDKHQWEEGREHELQLENRRKSLRIRAAVLCSRSPGTVAERKWKAKDAAAPMLPCFFLSVDLPPPSVPHCPVSPEASLLQQWLASACSSHGSNGPGSSCVLGKLLPRYPHFLPTQTATTQGCRETPGSEGRLESRLWGSFQSDLSYKHLGHYPGYSVTRCYVGWLVWCYV